jgi:hypothetical protein
MMETETSMMPRFTDAPEPEVPEKKGFAILMLGWAVFEAACATGYPAAICRSKNTNIHQCWTNLGREYWE